MKKNQNKDACYKHELVILKSRKTILETQHEKLWMKVICAENKLSDKESELINIEKQIRSLASKISWAKRKNK